MKGSIAAVVLAAGQSRRMRSRRSKVVHPLLGRPLILWLLENMAAAGIPAENTVLVCGENLEEVQEAVSGRPVRYAVQSPPMGTAHALLSAADQVADFSGELLVTVGDNPWITAGEIRRLCESHSADPVPCTFLSALFPHTPPPYGRVVRTPGGGVAAVVEELDATPDQLKLREVNSSIYLFHTPTVWPLLSRITNRNRKNEYYLTDIIEILHDQSHRVHALCAQDYRVALGINNRWDLQAAEREFNLRKLRRLAEEGGVTVMDPGSTTVECDVSIGEDTVLFPCTYIGAGTRIGRDCRIGPFAYLRNDTIPDGGVVPPCGGAVNGSRTE
ncbi:MAG TPA: hypothetical protein ENN40_03540 [Candidatus Aminicenantes bacterium]|nr:hypothetical protein [Candidatus Aminicenantes bacterium]